MTKLNGIFNTSELKINKNSDGVFEWSKGANKAIFDTKSNVIKMNTTGAFFPSSWFFNYWLFSET
nr:hypothetical protein [Mycoplasmopsis bovis]